MKTVLVILAPGFEETEAITIIDLLRRALISVTTASISELQVTGSHDITVIADDLLLNLSNYKYDMIVLPGGPGVQNLADSELVLETLKNQSTAERYIAAICAAPVVLNKAGLLKNKSITSYPSEETTFSESNYFYEAVVVDNKIITSRAVGTAIDFSLKLIEILQGKKVADNVAEKILHPIRG